MVGRLPVQMTNRASLAVSAINNRLLSNLRSSQRNYPLKYFSMMASVSQCGAL